MIYPLYSTQVCTVTSRAVGRVGYARKGSVHRVTVLSNPIATSLTLLAQGCTGPGSTGECSKCIELHLECLGGYNTRVPRAYRVRCPKILTMLYLLERIWQHAEIIHEITNWTRRRTSRSDQEKLPLRAMLGRLVPPHPERLSQVSISSIASQPPGEPLLGVLSDIQPHVISFKSPSIGGLDARLAAAEYRSSRSTPGGA